MVVAPRELSEKQQHGRRAAAFAEKRERLDAERPTLAAEQAERATAAERAEEEKGA